MKNSIGKPFRYKLFILVCCLFSAFLSSAQFIPTQGPNKPGDLEVLWAHGDSAYFLSDSRFYFTEDGGTTNQDLTWSLPDGAMPSVLTVANGKVYMGSRDKSRAYLSVDGGTTWNSMDGSSVLWIPTHIASNGKDVIMGGTLFDPHYYDESQQKWISSGLGGTTHALRYVDDNTVIANVGSASRGTSHISTDGGKTWTQLLAEPSIPVVGNAKVYDFLKVGRRLLAIANFNGYNTFYSDDNGDSWTEASGYKVYSLGKYGRKFNATKDGVVWLRDQKSIDTGRTWIPSGILLSDGSRVWKDEEFLSFKGSIGLTGDITTMSFQGFSGGLFASQNGVHTIYGDYINNYNGISWTQDAVKDAEDLTINLLVSVNNATYVDGMFYLLTRNGIFESANGYEYKKVLKSNFEFTKVTAFDKIGNTFILCEEPSRGGRPPKVHYSSDMVTWTEGVFSNNVGNGMGGTINTIDRIMSHNGKIVLDMAGGLAVSSDQGKTWKWKGGAEGGNVVSSGSTLVRLSDNGFGTRKLQYSSDDGDSWTEVFTGMPDYTGQSNYAAFGDVFEIEGKIYVDAWASERRLMAYNLSSNEWEETEKNSRLPQEGWPIELAEYDGILYAGIEGKGVYKLDEQTGFVPASIHDNVTVYPNPSHSRVTLSSAENADIRVYNLNGEILELIWQNGVADVSGLEDGVYFVRIIKNGILSSAKLIVAH